MAVTPFSFDRVVTFGASILNSMGDRTVEYMEQSHGLTVAYQNSSVGGRTPAAGAAAIDPVIAGIPGGEIAVVVVHLGGNGLANIMPPENTTERAEFLADMGYIYDAITTAGHICIPTSISFRDYDGDYGGNSYDDPYLYGSERINADVLIPFIATKFPDQINTNGRPYFDMHNRFYNDGPIILDVDGRHLAHRVGATRYMLDTIVALSTVGSVAPLPRFADPRTVVRQPASVNINFFTTSTYRAEVAGLNTISEVAGPTEILDANNEQTGMVLTHAGVSSGSQGVGDTTAPTLDYLTPRQTRTYTFANGGESNEYTLTGVPQLVDVVARIASSRNTTGERVTVFSADGVEIGSINSADPTEAPHFETTFTTSGTGALVLSHTGITFNYINSMEMDFAYTSPGAGGMVENMVQSMVSQLIR